MGIIGSYILMMFYTMVGGWMFYYAYLELSGKLAGLNADGIKETFNNMLGNPGSMMFFAIIAILLAFGVCALGLQNGVLAYNKGCYVTSAWIDGNTCYPLICPAKCIRRY